MVPLLALRLLRKPLLDAGLGLLKQELSNSSIESEETASDTILSEVDHLAASMKRYDQIRKSLDNASPAWRRTRPRDRK